MVSGFQQLIMKQVKKFQEDLAKIQDELAAERLEGSAGGGVVKVSVNGMGEIQGIKIDPEVVNPEDVEMLQDLITAAFRDAFGQAADLRAKRMEALTGGLGIKIPGLF